MGAISRVLGGSRAGLVLAAFVVGALGPAAAADERRPNVLFIAIDDQNDWIGCLGGHPQVKTPRIDALAARGTLFANAHCQSPLCNPSRTSLMTSRRPTTTGIYGLSPWIRDVEGFEDVVSLPQHFAAHGYRTLTTGKIYHGGYGRRESDREWDVIGPGASAAPFPPDGKLVDTPSDNRLVDWGSFPHEDEDKGDWKVATWAVEQLESMSRRDTGDAEEDRQPFFLSVGFFLPHVPCYATRKWFDLYPVEVELPPVRRDDRDDTPRFSWLLHWQLPEPRLRFLEEAGEWHNLVRSYLACTSFVDAQVGRVLDALEASGHADDTVVVLWSDHGWHLGEKLITGKNTLWDRSTRVPLIFAGPGVAAEAVCDQPAELLDVYPTLIDLCRLNPRDDLEGLSLAPQLADAGAPRTRPAITSHNPGNHGIRTREWRYIRYADGSEELYDMRTDPNEWTNLAGRDESTDILAELRRWLPENDAPHAPNSSARILEYDPATGHTVWEGREVDPDDPIPEI